MTVRTRFAPSPTGFLHIGGVRTALFSYLFARRHGGEFVLRIEDTDRERSTDASVQVILDGLSWLGLESDVEPVFQTDRFDRYNEIIEQLLASGDAYYCYCTKEELDERREAQRAAGLKPRYDGRCRDGRYTRDDIEPVVRFKNPLAGAVVVEDLVQGRVSVANQELDDLIIRRSDGTPTYNLSVVVDDIDMGITHVIRGDDHLNNTPRQINIMQALGLAPPKFAHLPMILGPDGSRLSKRHGAVSVLEFRRQGILPQALLNYLIRLGWSHGDQEIFSMDEMIELFSLESVNKSASSMDYEKLLWVNQHYIKAADDAALGQLLAGQFDLEELGHRAAGLDFAALAGAQRDRARSLSEMVEKSRFIFEAPADYDEKAAERFLNEPSAALLKAVCDGLAGLADWTVAGISDVVRVVMKDAGVKMPMVAQPLRLALTGTTQSPSIDVTLFLVGRNEALRRIRRTIDWVEAGA